MPGEGIDETPGGRRCATCLYGYGVKSSSGLLLRLECRRYPPRSGTPDASYWYPVSPTEWCGEWVEYEELQP
ncbi:MAG: hypothetical protein R2826_11155 [Thermoleophilia bacterium]